MRPLRNHVMAGLLAVALAAPATGAEDCAAVAGLWFDPALDGEGFNLVESDAGLVVTYYAYSDSGQLLWLISEVFTGPFAFGQDIDLAMFIGEGGSFQQPAPPSELESWGSVSLNFTDRNSGVFSLSGSDGDKVAQVIKLAGIRGQDCRAAFCIIATDSVNRLDFPNDGNQGIFDPSLAAAAGAGEAWLSYSTVSASTQWPQRNLSVIHNRLARSTDGGASFSFVNETNTALDVTLGLAPPNDAGTWVNEVSSLAYDAAAEAGERWKLIWHRYLQINGERRFEHGWLGYRAAATPAQLKDAPEIKLFAAGLYDPVNDDRDAVTRSPVGGAPLIDVRDLDPELALCSVLSEPGWMSDAEALYLAVGCYQVAPRENRMILLACAHPCTVTDMGAWRFVATLLVNADAQALGFERYSAPDLFAFNGATYLWVTPGSDSPFPDAYNGCRAFRFEDLAAGVLVTDAGGHPIPGLSLDGLPDSFNGACAMHTAAGERAFYSQLMLPDTDRFQVFRASAGGCFH